LVRRRNGHWLWPRAVEGKNCRGAADIRNYFDDLFARSLDVRTEDVEIRDLQMDLKLRPC
jgi:hypothetical protein